MNTVSIFLRTGCRLEILNIKQVRLLLNEVLLSFNRNHFLLQHVQYLIHLLAIRLYGRQALVHLFELNDLMLMKVFPHDSLNLRVQLLQVSIFHF